MQLEKHLSQLVCKPFVFLWKSIMILVWSINNLEGYTMYQMSNVKFKEREWIAGDKSVSVLYSKMIPFLWSLSKIPTSIYTPFWTWLERGVETLKCLHWLYILCEILVCWCNETNSYPLRLCTGHLTYSIEKAGTQR